MPNLPKDVNSVSASGGVSDLDGKTIYPLRINPTTGRLLVSAVLGGTYLVNPMTTTGDIIYSSDNSGTPARLGIGASGTILVGGTIPTYSATPTITTSLTVPLLYGSSAANGDISIKGTSSATKTTSYVLLQEDGGLVGIATTTPTSTNGGLDIASGGLTLVLGADSDASTRTNTTNKFARIGCYHYTNAQEPMALIYGQATSTANTIGIGGGTSSMNAATNVKIFTAANSTTTTGTERFDVDSTGNVKLSTNNVWLRQTDFAGTSYVNMFKVNASDEIETGGTLSIGGYLEGPADGGAITVFDMPVVSAADGTEESATFKLGGSNILKLYSLSTGAGAVDTTSINCYAPLLPNTSDLAALGSATLMWSDLFLASGGVINFNNGNATLTHSTGLLTSNVPLSLGITNALTCGSIEIGDSSNTTITRVGAGILAIEGARIITSTGTTSGTILKNNGTTFVASTETYAAPGTYGNVMTSDGTNWTSAPASSGSIPTFKISTAYETAGRFSTDNTNGSFTFGTTGILLNTTATQASKCNLQLCFSGNINQFAFNPQFAIDLEMLTEPSDGDIFIGVGSPAVSVTTGHDFTDRQFGFKIVYASSTATLYATNGNNTAETATEITGITLTDVNFFHAIMDSGTNIKFYVNGVLKATHTTNLPDATNGSCLFQVSASNKNVATQIRLYSGAFSVDMDMQ